MGNKYRRPISVIERIWLGFNEAFGPYVNQAVLEGTGRLDFKNLEAAVATASEANPGSRIILKGALRGSYWLDSGVCPRVRKIHTEWDGSGPDNAPFLCDPLPHTGPTCEVVYLEGSIPRIIFRTSHGVMDGIGTQTWMEDVFRILRGEKPIGSSSTLSEYLLVRSLSDKTMKMHPADNIAPTGKAGKNIPGTTWKRLTIPGTHTKLLGRVGMALARSAWKYGEGRVRIGIPVDVRPRKPGLRSTGNLSMALYPEIVKNSTVDSITFDVIRRLRNRHDCICVEGGENLDLVPIWLMGLAVKLTAKMFHMTGRYNVSGIISNHGIVDVSKFSGGGFNADTIFFVPPGVDGMPAFITLAGNMDNLEIAVSLPNTLADEGRFERLLNDIEEAVLKGPSIIQQKVLQEINI